MSRKFSFLLLLVRSVFSVISIAMAARRLKLLHFTQEVYQDMGIYPRQSNLNWHSINWRIIFMLVSFIQMFIFSLAFLIFEADNIIDVGTAFYTVNSEFCCIVYYLVLMYKMPKILTLIENFEKFIKNSKLVLEVMKFISCLLN